jgi:hypothetical protein
VTQTLALTQILPNLLTLSLLVVNFAYLVIPLPKCPFLKLSVNCIKLDQNQQPAMTKGKKSSPLKPDASSSPKKQGTGETTIHIEKCDKHQD